MKKYTKHLFIFSVSMSLISLVLIEKGYKEMYPFASWKLFTVPSGGTSDQERYVLYGLKNSDTVKIIYSNSEKYEANDKALITDTYGQKIDKNEDREISRKKLIIFAKDIEPEYKTFLLYKEIYDPKEIGGKMRSTKHQFITKL